MPHNHGKAKTNKKVPNQDVYEHETALVYVICNGTPYERLAPYSICEYFPE